MINARKNKNDEFYTLLSDIENELKHYKKHFKNKTILCNCDDPRTSKFFHYFSHNFEDLKLKKLIITCYKNRQSDLFNLNNSERAIYLEYDGGMKTPATDKIGIKHLKGDGDFRSGECVEILKQADIIVTNPPFSLFREYVDQLIYHDKKFIIIGNVGAISYGNVFKLLKENKIWLGINIGRKFSGFVVPEHYELYGTETRIENKNKIIFTGNTCWFTNMDVEKRRKKLTLHKKYDKNEYPKYDNYDAINVDKTKDIPVDYYGMIGVPITFIDKYNPNQFEIISLNNNQRLKINGKYVYARIIIKRKE